MFFIKHFSTYPLFSEHLVSVLVSLSVTSIDSVEDLCRQDLRRRHDFGVIGNVGAEDMRSRRRPISGMKLVIFALYWALELLVLLLDVEFKRLLSLDDVPPKLGLATRCWALLTIAFEANVITGGRQ